MGLLNELGGLLQQYKGASPSARPDANAEKDFQQVAQLVPQSSVSSALGEAFRSSETPPFGQMVSQLFGQSNGEQQAGILNHLISSLGPAALSGSSFGGLSSLLQGNSTVSTQQAQAVSPEVVQDLANHAAQKDPSIMDKAGDFYAQHPTLVQGLGAGVLAFIMSRISHR